MLLYPTLSDYWNSFHQTKVITDYTKDIDDLNKQNYNQILTRAQDYNKSLLEKVDRYEMSKEEVEEYESQLNASHTGVIGYIEIEKIDCFLPIYHGTDNAVLQTALGHLEGTSLPVGGNNTHCVISGHRGLPSAKLFTDLDKMKKGDIFVIHTLDEILTYEVDRILVVDPEDYSALAIEEGQDYCTLMTCTPYGINTQRLLVRGHRIANRNDDDSEKKISNKLKIDLVMIIILIVVPVLLFLLFVFLVKIRKNRR